MTILCFCLVLSIWAMPTQKDLDAFRPEQAQRYNPPPRFYHDYSFSIYPMQVFRTYYDYMIGSFNGSPLQLLSTDTGTSYMMTFHGSRQANANRRAFYAYIENGEPSNSNEITEIYTNEGFPSLTVDPILNVPLYAFQGNCDVDSSLEIQFVADAFIAGFSGLFNYYDILINNPLSIVSGSTTTTDNVFLWPVVTTGPSPVMGHRRAYVLCTNATGHGAAPGGNPIIAMTDFEYEDILTGTNLVWSYVTVPELNVWNIDPSPIRRPYLTILADNAGNIFLCGYHETTLGDNRTSEIDIFKCANYGVGTWTRSSNPCNLASWNPPSALGSSIGYFTDDGIPYDDSELYWSLKNSSHFNAVQDANGKIHIPGLWALCNSDGDYYPALQFVKDIVVDPYTNQFTVRDISPQKHQDDQFNANMQPWDQVYPFGQVDYWVDEVNHSIPGMLTAWNFPYHDATAHDGSMMYHYNNIKLSINKEQNLMAAVWQNCTRAWIGMTPWINTPEIHIALSPDNGVSWSEPIILNNIDNPQLANIKPMWVYPANTIKYVGMQGNRKVGKLGLMFLDDYTWGSQAISPPVHNNIDGGRVMFTELEIVFPYNGTNIDPFGNPQGTPNMVINAEIRINNFPASPGDIIGAFAMVGGQEQLRGKATVVSLGLNDEITACVLPVSVVADGEQLHLKYWSDEYNMVANCSQTLTGEIDGAIGTWPSNLLIINFDSTGAVDAPSFFPPPATYSAAQNVTLSCSTAGAIIRYTTDGTEPTLQSTIYNTPIHIGNYSNVTIKAVAHFNHFVSETSVATYTITGALPTPVFSPSPGVYTSAQAIQIFCSVPEALIRYTINGDNPHINSPVYTGPIHLPEQSATTIRAKAFATNWNPSAVAIGNYTINGTLPGLEINPPSGDYSHPLVLTISCPAPGVEIHYCTNGDVPDWDSPHYVGPLQIDQSTTIRARALKEGWNPGPVLTAAYNIAVENEPEEAAPAFTGIHSLYPNPFRDQLFIRLGIKDTDQAYSISVYNIRGEQVYRNSGRAGGFVDLSWDGRDAGGMKLAAGLYLVRFQSGAISQTRKLVRY